MRLLLDTNVIVHLEDATSPLEGPASELARLAHAHGVALHVHPLVLVDFERDPNSERKAISVSKAGKYPALERPPDADDEFITLSGSVSNDNDRVDVAMLFAIQRDCAGFLVTEDRDLHKRAERTGLADRVYYVQQAVDALRSLFEPRVELPPKVEDIEMNQLDLADAFFDGLKEDYVDEFGPWFVSGQRSGRRAWVIREGDTLHGVCIYKPEDVETRRTLKLCTFKVGEYHRGQHLGELMLKTAFGFCARNNFTNAYVEVLPKQDFLIDFLDRFGFDYIGLKSETTRDEGVYRKTFGAGHFDGDALAYHVAFAPSLPPDPRTFFVPVQPEFHDQLFPDALPGKPEQLMLDLGEADGRGTAVGNAIRKAYLCHAPTTKLMPGDVLAFYRSHDLRAFTTFGVVERTLRSADAEQIAGLVGKRTVYSYADIVEMSKKPVLVILFRQAIHMATPVTWTSLAGNGFPSRAWQSITELPEVASTRLMEQALVDTA